MTARLLDRLPAVRGRIEAGASLARYTWFRTGGPAEVLFRPADEADLAAFLAAKPAGVPVTLIGVGSNLLVRDGGVPGIVIHLGKGFSSIRAEGNTLHVGAGALDVTVAATATSVGLAGMEFLSGVPGTIGGALRMNAGAYGSDMAAITTAAIALDGQGARHRLVAAALGFTYRHSAIPEDWVFIGAELAGTPDDTAAIAERVAKIRQNREDSQPLRTRTGGSTFTNPPGQSAWKLVDEAGCRGLTIGGAQVSEKHTNFLINTGSATAADIEALGEEVRRRVLATSGIELHWEIRRIGVAQ